MKLTNISGALLGLTALAIISSPFVAVTEAVADDDSGLYIGGSIGQTRAKIDDARITRSLLRGGVTANSILNDNRGTAYKLFGGYQYNQYISLEGGYFDLGTFGYTAVTAAPSAGTVTGQLKLRGVNIDLLGSLPLTESLSLLGRVGGTYAQTRDHFTTTGALTVVNPNPTKLAWNYKVGAGLEYDITEPLGLRIEAERYRVNDALNNHGDIDFFSAGLIYRFGTSSPPAPHAEASKPEPKPVLVAAAPVAKKAPLIKVSFSTDSLFVFDSTTINPTAKQGLDKLAGELTRTNFDMIFVTGYTDRIGSHAYNMELSTARAEAVKAYLMDTAAIPAAKITAKGLGESDSVTQPGQCRGVITEQSSNDMARRLKACLAPDRRVEVEVDATQKRK